MTTIYTQLVEAIVAVLDSTEGSEEERADRCRKAFGDAGCFYKLGDFCDWFAYQDYDSRIED